MIVGTEKLLGEATEALKRVQEFDVETLPREDDLGRALNLRGAVVPAQALVDLFKRLSLQALEDFPDPVLTVIRDQANAVYNIFAEALKFDTAQANPQQIRQGLLTNLRNAYTNVFGQLHPYISYSLHRSADFQRLDTQARATLQGVEDSAEKFAARMEKYEKDANEVLEAVRKVAAEQGVTQQAVHFRTESESHDVKAEEWRVRTVKLAWTLGVFAGVSLVLHKLPWIQPDSAYESFQLGLSKLLVFGVITYMLILSARNFMNHRHNAIVNKHRQNALMTHQALVEAVSDVGARDAVMIQAASCIFSPQPTGYTGTKVDAEVAAPRSVVELLSRAPK